MKLQQAQRNQVKLRLGLSGASGFGKSYSALLLAYGITEDWTKIAIIDTENNSASLYAHLGDFNVLQLNEPYSPERYIEAIRTCEKASIEVIIIDSITHEWQGKGGCLQLHEQLGGRFQDWAKISPRHQAFIDAILQSSCHIITTTRRKIDYSLDSDQNGRTKVVKHGTKEITRDGYEYELTVNFELINDQHLAVASKDRTGLFMNKPEFVISKGTGKMLKEWCMSGEPTQDLLPHLEEVINRCTTLEELRNLYTNYPNHQRDIKDKIIQKKAEIENKVSNIMSSDKLNQYLKNSRNGTDS
jgi:hypothetical protein